MDLLAFLFFFSWIALGFIIAEEFKHDLNFHDNPAEEHSLDTNARFIAFVVLWPIFLVISVVILFFEE